jgi:hypothetical protein
MLTQNRTVNREGSPELNLGPSQKNIKGPLPHYKVLHSVALLYNF